MFSLKIIKHVFHFTGCNSYKYEFKVEFCVGHFTVLGTI